MKKLLGAALVATMSITCLGALAACGDDDKPVGKTDAEIASEAIRSVRTSYIDKSEETPSDYEVMGEVKVDDANYTVNWSVSSVTVNDISAYVTVGAMNETTKVVTVSVTQSSEVVEYKLTASVTVGEVTETVSFNRKTAAPLTVAKVKEIAASVAQGEYYKENDEVKQVYVKGYVVDPGTFSTQYNNFNRVYIADDATTDKDSADALMIYRIVKDTTYLKQDGDITTGDTIVVSGYIQNYNGSLQISYSGTNNVTCVGLTKVQRTDAEIVAAAKEAVKLETDTYTEVKDTALPTTNNGATLSWAVKGESDHVSIDGSTLKVLSLPDANTEVTLTVTITSGEVTDTKDIAIHVYKLELEHAGTLEDPLSVADVQAIGKTLGSSDTYKVEGSAKLFYVTGALLELKMSDYTSYGNFNAAYIVGTYSADKTSASEDALMIYRLTPDGTNLSVANDVISGVYNGDTVVISGYIGTHNGNVQVTYNGTTNPKIESVTPDARADADKVAEVKNGLEIREMYIEAGNVTLPTTSTVRGVTVSWALSGEVSGVTVEENVLKIETIPATLTNAKLVATITSGEVTDTKEVDIKLVDMSLDHAGTQADPFSVKDLKAISTILERGEYYSDSSAAKLVYVEGYIVDAGSFSAQYKNLSHVYIVDEFNVNKDKDSADAYYVYRLVADGTHVTETASALGKGDKVVISGYIQNYNGNCQITYSGSNNATVVSRTVYVDNRTDAQKVQDALDGVNATLTEISSVGDVVLPVSNNASVTFAWVSDNAIATVADGKLTIAALPATDTEVTLTLTATLGEVTQNKEVKVTVKAANDAVKTIDLTTNFATYSGDWATGYSERSITLEAAGLTGVEGSIVLSRGSKQANTINDRPVLAANNSTVYVTVTVTGDISLAGVEFDLKQWSSSKKFSDFHIEYTLDGTDWVSCSEVITAPATLATNTTLPAGVKQVRLSISTTQTSNQQVGLSSIKLTVA